MLPTLHKQLKQKYITKHLCVYEKFTILEWLDLSHFLSILIGNPLIIINRSKKNLILIKITIQL